MNKHVGLCLPYGLYDGACDGCGTDAADVIWPKRRTTPLTIKQSLSQSISKYCILGNW